MNVLLKLLIAFLFCITSLYSASEKISLLLKWKHQFQFAGFYMAKEKGFYQEANLDVSIFESNQFTNGVVALENGDAEYAILDPQAFVAKYNGKKIQQIATIFQHSPLVLLSLKSSGIQTPNDLKNKKVMLELGTDDAALMQMFRKEGIPLNSMILSKTTFDVEDLIDRKVDVMSAYVTDQIYKLNKRGVEYNVIDPMLYGVDFYGDMLFTSFKEYKNNPQRVNKFLNASIKGWEYALKNVDETIKIIKEKYNSIRTVEHLEFEAKQVQGLIRNDRIPIGYISKDRVNQMLDAFKNQGLIKNYDNVQSSSYIEVKKSLPYQEFWERLTLEEIEYLQKRDVLKIAVMDNIPPYHYPNESGKFVGTHLEIFKLLKEYTRLPLELRPYEWADLMKNFKERKVDMFFGQKNSYREEFSIFSEVLVPLSYGIFSTNPNTLIHSIKDLENSKVAIVKGFAVKQMLAKYPKIKIIEKRTFVDAINSVLRGESDFTIGHILSINFFRKKYVLNELFLNGLAKEIGGGSRIGIRNDHPLLVSIMKKAIEMIPKPKLEELYNEWIFSDQKVIQKQQRLRLTTVEKKWLKEHPVLRVGNIPELAPFNFYKNGQAQGYAIDLQKEIAEYLGVELKFVSDKNFPDVVNKFKNKQIDIMPIFGKNSKREKFTLYSDPILRLKPILAFHQSETELNTITDLINNDKVLGIVKDYWIEEYFENTYKDLKVKRFDTLKQALDALSHQKVDAVADTSTSIRYYLNRHLMTNIRLGNELALSDKHKEFYIGIRDDMPILRNIIKKAYFAIPEDDIIKLQRRWFGEVLAGSKSLFILSDKEEAFLQNLSNLKLGVDSYWPPFEFMDNGVYKGLTKEFMEHLIKDRLALSYTPIEVKQWKENLDAIDNLERDLIAGIMETPERREKMLFSIPYMTMPLLIFGRDESVLIEGFESILGKKVAVVKGYVTEEIIQKKYPQIVTKSYDNVSEALLALRNKETDYLFEALPPVNYYIQEQGITNIKLLAKSGESIELSVGIRKDWPIMVNIINKAIHSMSTKKRQEIFDEWIKLNFETKIDYDLLWKMVAGFVFLLSIFMFWVQMLRREIEKRKETEKNLYQAQLRAEEANKAKSEFLSNMSHEIRTPMNAVIGFAELTSKMELPSKAIENIRIIQKSGKTLVALINDILDLSKIEAGKFEIKKEAVNVADMVEDIYSLFYLKAEKKGLDFNIKLSSYIPQILILDEIRVRQILINLIGNALKFTKEGSILVSFEVYVNENMDSTLDLHIKVKDTGIGVSEENKEKIFGLFEQQSGQNTRLYGGTGLGLAISQKLANLMGGEIVLSESSSKGSTFSLILKNITVASIAKAKKSKTSDSIINFPYAKVLVIDDIRENLILLKDALSEYGFSVLEATSGQEAIKMAKEESPQIVLMDIKMPKMDGYEASTLIKKQEESKNIPIVAVSASVLKEKEEISNHKAFDGFIPKPINMEELELELAKFLPHSYTKRKDALKIKDKTIFNCSNERKREIKKLAKDVLDDGDLLLAENLLLEIKKDTSLSNDVYDKLKQSVDNFNIEEMENCLRLIIEE